MRLAALILPLVLASHSGPYVDATETHLPDGLGRSSMDARPVDVDGDGDLDLVVACEFCPNIILINDGSGRFSNESAARLPQVNRDSEDIAAQDFDGDGDVDLVFVSEDDQINEYYLNDGTGKFTSLPFPVTGTTDAVVSADLNGDGAPDLILGNSGPNVILINNGSGGFVDETSRRLATNTATTQDLELGDIDGDGDLDLIEANENGSRVHLNTGAGVFSDQTVMRFPAADEETREADLGDVDGDGDLDLFLANTAFTFTHPTQNRLLLNDGTGVFSEAAGALPAQSENSVDGDFADLDGDGDLDLLTAQAFGGSFRVLLNDGKGVFEDATASFLNPVPTISGVDSEVADFSGDGLLDIYMAAFQGSDRFYLGTQ